MEEVQQLMDFLMQRHASDYIKKIVFASSPLILSHFSLLSSPINVHFMTNKGGIKFNFEKIFRKKK